MANYIIPIAIFAATRHTGVKSDLIKMNFLIIGAGQLGSRHLQGLLKLSGSISITIVDPSKESLDTTRSRANEIEHNHVLQFIEDINDLHREFFITIVATNSNVRSTIVESIIDRLNLTHLVLEKVLFQKLEDYQRIKNVIANKKTKVWVNHPRRMLQHYKKIKAELKQDAGPTMYTVYGGNWGLACNGLHYIDLFSFLSGSLPVEIYTDRISDTIEESKRAGYIEFSGTLNGKLENGDLFQLVDTLQNNSPITVTITQTESRLLIQESLNPQIIHLSATNNYEVESSKITVRYQSDLTTELAQQLMNEDYCDLPTYEEAAAAHQVFIESMLAKYNSLTSSQSDALPIT